MPENFREEARKRFPSNTSFSVDLPEGYKQQGTTFDHFGLMSMMKPGGEMGIYFDDLKYDGRSQDFTSDPNWHASGNRTMYQEKEAPGAHNFGFSPTGVAGDKPGELGGLFWRGGRYGYYADRVGPLGLADRLEAKGTVVLKVGAPDSDMYLGWFNSENKDQPPADTGGFVGVHVGGDASRALFQPAVATAKGTRGMANAGPVSRQVKFTNGRWCTIQRGRTGKGPFT